MTEPELDLELEERNSLRRVAGLSTELEDISEVEYRQLRLERVVLVGVWTEGTAEDAENSLTELKLLAETAGSEVLDAPEHDRETYPDGVNVEFVVREGDRHVAMRVHERGSGETRSCGTGACAVGLATALADESERPVTYRVDVPGGTLHVTWNDANHRILSGPAEIVARGDMEWIK